MDRLQNCQDGGKPFSEALEKTLAEWEAVRHLTKMEIVESDTDRIVRSLQEKGCSVMGLTTQGLALATRTFHQLKEAQIDLTSSAPSNEDQFLTQSGHGVLFRHGILFSSGTHKGEALFKFCEKIGYMPAKVARSSSWDERTTVYATPRE